MESHLLQMRGLKPVSPVSQSVPNRSHLLQMRGLKLAHKRREAAHHSRIFYRCVD